MASVTSDDDVDCVSITGHSEAGGSTSANSNRKRKSTSGCVFRAWCFQLMVKADLCDGTTAVEKANLLRGRSLESLKEK